MKAISAVEAKMMVNDLGRTQRGMNNGMMYESQNHQDEANPFRDYVEAIDDNDEKIARLEAALLKFAEMKSTGGDSGADPGQSYSPEDEEDSDDEEDEEEVLGDG
jgi:hypothetical protein